MNWPSQNDAQFGSLVKPGKLNPGGLSSRIPHWIYPLGFLMSLISFIATLPATHD
jgi:hypothetical protein